MTLRRALLCCCATALACSVAATAAALDVSSGLLRLTLYEGQGRFALAAMANPADPSFTPLLFADDPTTSFLSVLVGNRVYRLGESGAFKEAAETSGTGGKFTWTSSFLEITESFTFISSPGSDLADGVRIDLQIRNRSEQRLEVGVRYLFDTWLGEASRLHFRTPALPELGHELTLGSGELPSYWASPRNGAPDALGLQSMLTAPGVSRPDRVIFANWKRLNDSPWGYESSASRSFNSPPFSINDSAVCQFYDPRPVGPGEQFALTLVLGRATARGFSIAPAGSAAVGAAAAPAAPSAEVLATRADLDTLNRLISEIDRLLAGSSAPSDEELAGIEQALATLKERAAAAGR